VDAIEMKKKTHYRSESSKTARAIVIGGLAVSFSVLCIGRTALKIKSIAMKPFNSGKIKNGHRDAKSGRCSSDLF
jgi:hypothetical protein